MADSPFATGDLVVYKAASIRKERGLSAFLFRLAGRGKMARLEVLAPVRYGGKRFEAGEAIEEFESCLERVLLSEKTLALLRFLQARSRAAPL